MTRVALLGAGAIARAHADALAALPGCELAAVADTDFAAARRLADPAGARAFPGVEALLAEDRPDAAIVCVPPAMHEGVVAATLSAGVPTLCEKPLAPTPAAARRMAALAASTGTLLALASKFRFAAGVLAAKRLLDSGELGAVRLAEIAFTSSMDMAGRWHADPAVSGGGVVMDNGPHAADLARLLFGPVAAVSATELAPRRLAVEESAALNLRTAGGATVAVLLSWVADARRPWYLAIHAANGSAEVGWAEARARLGGGGWNRIAPGYSKADCFAALMADFLDSARRGRAPAVGVADALAAVGVVDAAYRSLARGNWCDPTPEADRA